MVHKDEKGDDMSRKKRTWREISRREFVKGAALSAGALAGAGGLASCGPAAAPQAGVPEKWDKEADVVVVGFGGAGAPAAIEAHDAGANVLILEKMATPGGSNILNGGAVYAVGSPVQKDLGVECSVEEQIQNVSLMAGGRNEPEGTRTLIENSGKSIEWLESIGLQFPRDHDHLFVGTPGMYVMMPHLNWISSTHLCGGGGVRWVQVLVEAVESRGIEVLYDTPAQRLIAGSGTEVLGVKAVSGGTELSVKARKAVILASGGYGLSADLLRESSTFYDVPLALNGPGNTGDGIRMAEAVGARVMNMDSFGYNVVVKNSPGTGVMANGMGGPPEISLSENAWRASIWAHIYVNEKGEQIAPYAPVVAQQQRAFIVLDEATRKASVAGGEPYGYPQDIFVGAPTFTPDLNKEIDSGLVLSADTIQELATKAGIDPSGLTNAIAAYMEAGHPGVDAGAIDTPPFYAVEIGVGSPVVTPAGGAKVDAKAQVINAFGEVIPRLYAAGEASAVHFGPAYPACGGSLAECVCFGRIAAKNAAAEEPWS
jgi:succinate dehydrogenase/fumarate reductase flavoprotein subunit